MRQFPNLSLESHHFIIGLSREEFVSLFRYLSQSDSLHPVLRDLHSIMSNFSFEPLSWSIVEVDHHD